MNYYNIFNFDYERCIIFVDGYDVVATSADWFVRRIKYDLLFQFDYEAAMWFDDHINALWKYICMFKKSETEILREYYVDRRIAKLI